MKLRILSLLVILTLMPGISLTASAQTPEQQKETPAAETRSAFKVQIFEVKHRDPATLSKALDGLRSSAPNTAMVPNRDLKTITVRDFPENLAAIADAIKRLDVPEATTVVAIPADIEFNLHLIAASQTAGEKAAFPPVLESVVTQLRSTLKFSNYRYVTTFNYRVNDGGAIEGNGVFNSIFPATGSASKSFYRTHVRAVRFVQDQTGKNVFLLNRFSFSISIPIDLNGSVQYKDIGITTELNLREGETAVVGTANVGTSDEAIIVVVTARKVK